MKKLIYVCVCFLALSLTACSNDDDGASNERECNFLGQEVVIRNNGNGTLSIIAGGESQEVDLEGESFETVADALCSAGEFDFDFLGSE
ncbi:hypothetical protein JM658_01900 [Joostella atrarenae]|uniref:Uncharacterized protein n=2 Tax=Joostella TaxID=453850 RepID=A0ABS9IZR0_9FLAO|nr:hypothetical protein [Joostella atrarenae]MCF8713565.1 hypothetical protein [Joostella atrarenae]